MVNFECKEKYDVNDLRKMISLLRGEGGCPWDREQTHESIRRNLLEEAYEVCEAIDEQDVTHLREELGDLLMQVVFHARMEEERGAFDLDGVADVTCRKLILRHPHVFGDINVSGTQEVLSNWDEIKRRERAQNNLSDVMDGVAKSLPALWRAEKIQKKAAKIGFDWPDISGAICKLREELGEFEEASDGTDMQNAEEELGDLLFAAVNAARFLDIDPERALHRGCDKFIRRFKYLEAAAAKEGGKPEDMTLEQLEELYQRGKASERG